MWHEHLSHINLSKQRINLLNDKMRPVHSTPYRAEPTTMQLAAAETNQMLAKNFIQPMMTE